MQRLKRVKDLPQEGWSQSLVTYVGLVQIPGFPFPSAMLQSLHLFCVWQKSTLYVTLVWKTEVTHSMSTCWRATSPGAHPTSPRGVHICNTDIYIDQSQPHSSPRLLTTNAVKWRPFWIAWKITERGCLQLRVRNWLRLYNVVSPFSSLNMYIYLNST